MRLLAVIVALATLVGCNVARTQHDDIRSSCIVAANAHGLVTRQALAGKIPVDTFVAVDEAWDGIAADCTAVLKGDTIAPAVESRVRAFNARYGEAAFDAE